MANKAKVLIIGEDSNLARQVLKEKHGDVDIYTPEQAVDAGLQLKDFENMTSLTIEDLNKELREIERNSFVTPANGQQKRNQRRKQKSEYQKIKEQIEELQNKLKNL